MFASRRIDASTPSTVTCHLKITGLNAASGVVATYVDMDFSRSNTTFAFTTVTGIPTINVASGSGVVRLRILLTDNTTGTDTYGMIVDDLSLVFVTPPTIAGPDTICQSSAATFSVNDVAATGIYYNWTFSGGASPATSTVATPSVSWTTGGAKNIVAILGNGTCIVDTETYNVFVGSGVNITRNDSICGNSGYLFGGRLLTTSGSYRDTITSAGGCDSIINLNLVVRPIDTTFLQDSVCSGVGYSFNGNVYFASGIYLDTLVAVTGCDSLLSLNLKVLPAPEPPVLATPLTYCQFDPALPLYGVGTGLLWYTTATGGTGSAASITPATDVPGDFSFYASQTISGCESPRAEAKVTVIAKPIPSFTYNIEYSCNADTVYFTNSSVNAMRYEWYFGDGFALPDTRVDPVHHYGPVYVSTARVVKLYAYNGGCVDSAIVPVPFTPNPNPKFQLTQVTADNSIAFGSTIQLNAAGALIYYWTPNDGSLSDPNINNPIARPLDSTTYTVYGYDAYGCLDTAVVHVNVIHSVSTTIPSAFTPNGDGKNDVFRVAGRRFEKLVDFSVFNRWGEKVYQSADFNTGWDGTFNGVPQSIGVYFYHIIVATSEGANKTYTGTVTLIR